MPTVMPMIVVDDVDAVSDFYQNTLGFEQTLGMRTPDGAMMMIMVDNGHDACVMFNQAHPDSPAPTALNPDGLALYLTTEDVDAYHDAISGKAGVEVVEGPTDQFWGDRTIMVRDPWGLHLWFCQHTGQMSAPPEGFDIEMKMPVG